MSWAEATVAQTRSKFSSIAERLSELKCGVAVVEVRSGEVVALLEFQSAVEEIFDVRLLPGLRFPEVIGFQKEAVQHTFIVPK